MSAVDTLKTVLELVNHVSAPAEAAGKSIDALSEELRQLIDKLEKAEKKTDELGDELFQAATIGKVFKEAFQEAGGSPLEGLIKNSKSLGTQLGTQLAPAISQVSTFLAGPGGLALAAGTAVGAVSLLSAGVGFLGSALSTVGTAMAGLGPMLGQGAGMAIAMPLMNSLQEFDANVRLFSAVYGSRDKANQMVGFLEDYGLKSNFSQGPLTSASKTLALGGQDVNRFLPVLETIGLFGGGTDEAMSEVGDVIKRLLGGQIADAFGPEGLGRFGINRGMLEGAGATFNKGGQFQGGSAEAMLVLENLTKTHEAMRRIREEMQGSVASTTSNFWDAINKNVRLFATSIAEDALPMLVQFTEGLKGVADSGAMGALAETFKDVFGLNGSMAVSFNTIAATFLATIDTGLRMAKNGYEMIANALQGIDPFLAKVQAALLASDNPISKAAGAGLAGGRLAFNWTMDMMKGALEGTGDTEANFGENYQKYMGLLDAQAAKKKGEDKTAPDSPANKLAEAGAKAAEVSAQHLQAIRANTQVMAEASIQRMILGGGELGSHGVTPYQVSSMRGRSTGSPVERAVKDLVNAVYEDGARRLQSYDNMIQGRA
jgi:hypothetical protein